MRPHYAEYVKHAMRFYSRNMLNASSAQPRFKTEADKKNWFACQAAVKTFSAEEMSWLMSMYADPASLPEAVKLVAEANCVNQDKLWSLVNDFEFKFAKRRGLI